MPKIDRVLALLALLSHRRSVSLDTIRHVLGIPKRTVYRYLNTLSQANVPLIYDRNTGGYRLLRTPEIALPGISDNEMVVMTTILLLARRHLNPNYRSSVDSIVDKLLVHQRLPLEQIVDALGSVEPQEITPPDFSPELTAAIIQLAVTDNLVLKLVRIGSMESQEHLIVTNPALLFKRSWHLADHEANPKEVFNTDSIVQAAIGESKRISET